MPRRATPSRLTEEECGKLERRVRARVNATQRYAALLAAFNEVAQLQAVFRYVFYVRHQPGQTHLIKSGRSVPPLDQGSMQQITSADIEQLPSSAREKRYLRCLALIRGTTVLAQTH